MMPTALRGYAERAMTDRCTIERNQADSEDPFGGDSPPDWQTHLTDQACKGWVASGREAVSETRSALVEDWNLGVPVGTDILPGDRVVALVNQRGESVIDHTLYVEQVLNKRDQLVCPLERRG